MQVKTFCFNRSDGWNDSLPTDWDSPQTMVIIFGAVSFYDASEPIIELVEKFPQSKIVGCSTAGEIIGATINDESLVVGVVKFEKTIRCSDKLL